MSKTRATWLLTLAAATALAATAGQAAAPAPTQAGGEQIQIKSFSGAYLAARVAEVDNDLGSAIGFYKRALAFDPANTALQQSLMLALLAQGRFDEAVPYADMLKSTPDIDRFARVALAIDGFRKRDFKAAGPLLKFSDASELDVLIGDVLSAWARDGAGDRKGAVQALEKIKGPDWSTLFVTYHKALAAEQAGMAETAGKAFAKAVDDVEAAGAAPDTWLRAAEAYAGFLARQGRKDAALAVLDKTEPVAPGRVPIEALRKEIMDGKKPAMMISSAREGAAEFLLNLATALNRGGGEAYVKLYLQFALALAPDSDMTLIQLASVAEQEQRAADAIALYRRIPEASPLKRMSELQLGLNLADLDRRDEAIKQLTTLLDASPDDMRAYLALGGVYSSKEDYRNAAEVYDRAAKQIEDNRSFIPNDPRAANNWNVYYQRGIAYERLKEWPKAEPNFRRALELQPNQPQVLNYLGYSMVDMNMNLDEGMEMIRQAVDLRPSDGYIVDSLGWAHYRLGQYEDAVRELERAVSLKPDDPVLNDHLGDAYWRVGRKLEATFQWSHARDLKPDADVLATVQKKLAEGLPPIARKTAAEDLKPSLPADEPAKAPDTKG